MSVVVYYPSIPQSSIEDLATSFAAKEDKANPAVADADTSFDFTNDESLKTTISANAVIAVTGINSGETKTALIKNTHATTQYGVTIPDTYDSANVLKYGDIDVVYIPAGWSRRFYFYHNGTALEISWDGLSYDA